MKRIQNRIAESRWALPITAAYGLLVTFGAGLVTNGLWLNFALLLVSTIMMAELNNMNALIRIYSRMVSCSFLVMTTMSLFLFRSLDVDIVQLTFIAFLLLILRTYQDQSAVGLTFYAYLALGIGSVVFPHMLLFVPVLWVLIAVFMQSFSIRTFFASVMGVIFPYWFVVAWLIYTNNVSWLWTHLLSTLQFEQPFALEQIGLHQWITFAYVALISIIGAVHFLAYSYKDRIRIRMIYEMFILLDILCFFFALIQPQHFNGLLGMAIVCSSPIAGHFLALTNSRLSNITFIVLAVLALAITVFNITLTP